MTCPVMLQILDFPFRFFALGLLLSLYLFFLFLTHLIAFSLPSLLFSLMRLV